LPKQKAPGRGPAYCGESVRRVPPQSLFRRRGGGRLSGGEKKSFVPKEKKTC